jgi:NADP-dependent 3-hydroxy acid dehydrogenase YdfG
MPSVLITGASQGSGKATALLFARQGYDVVLAARQSDRLQTVAEEITASGRRALAVPTDVGQLEQVRALVNQALAQFGAIDVLVNNAGICLTGTMAQTSADDWQQVMNTNFWGYVYTIQALLPHFLAQGRGTIVNVGSFGGKMPLPNMTAYCASKYAVTGLTETLRLELKPQGIHVAAVHPGVINSSFMERAMFRGQDEQETQARQSQMEKALKGTWVSQPEDIANAIWEVVEQQRSEIVVGPVAIATEAYRLAPGLVQWMLGQATNSP